MFEFEPEVRRWRTALDRRSSLSPRELDELEDHLRARVDLELELDAALAPAEAFAIARRDLGEPTALSRDFVRAGRRRWRPLLLAGWALFAASLLLPVVKLHFPPFLGGVLTVYGYDIVTDPGFLVFNLPMLLTLSFLSPNRRSRGTWLAVILGGMGTLTLGGGLAGVITGGGAGAPGFWAWSASLALASAALWLRRRDWASARLKKSIA